jgi:hypothetical protein
VNGTNVHVCRTQIDCNPVAPLANLSSFGTSRLPPPSIPIPAPVATFLSFRTKELLLLTSNCPPPFLDVRW